MQSWRERERERYEKMWGKREREGLREIQRALNPILKAATPKSD